MQGLALHVVIFYFCAKIIFMRFFNGNFVKFTLGFISIIVFGVAGILLGGYYDDVEKGDTSAEVIK